MKKLSCRKINFAGGVQFGYGGKVYWDKNQSGINWIRICVYCVFISVSVTY